MRWSMIPKEEDRGIKKKRVREREKRRNYQCLNEGVGVTPFSKCNCAPIHGIYFLLWTAVFEPVI